MALTLTQALQKGIEAHKAGQLQQADRYYTAILKGQPKHPDANHNMGVLTVGLGKTEKALPYLKTALDADPSITQFWLSYIDALIKLHRMADAKNVLDRARDNGAGGEAFDQLKAKVDLQTNGNKTNKSVALLKKAIDFRERGKYPEAINILISGISEIPNSAELRSLLSYCYMLNDDLENATVSLDEAKQLNSELPTIGWNEARLHLKNKKSAEALSIARNTSERFPNDVEGMGVLGNCLRVNNEIEESLFHLEKAISQNPTYTEALINRGLAKLAQNNNTEGLADLKNAFEIKPHLKQLGKILHALLIKFEQYEEAINISEKQLDLDANNEELVAQIAFCHQHLGNTVRAIDNYKKALKINPDYAEAYNNLGSSLQEKGDLDSAIDNYKKALKIKPGYFEAYNNLGSAFTLKGDLDTAIDNYKKAIKINPGDFEAYNNMGATLRSKGDLDAAVESYKKALKIEPGYAQIYNNMGSVLLQKGDLDSAIDNYKKALKIKPNYAGAFWNLSSSAQSIVEAQGWLEKCLAADGSYRKAKLTLAAYKVYTGDRSDFDYLMQSSSKDDPYMRSYAWAFSLPELPNLYFNKWAFFDAIAEQSIHTRPFYEFGVWRGDSFKYLIKTFIKGYGFDTFEGLPEDWHDERKGKYSSDGKIPEIAGGEFIVGKFEDTLPIFFSEPRSMASIINFDADLYSSTLCALNYSKPVIDEYTVLIFDEFIMNEYWEQDEFKALEEFCYENNITYEVIAISFYTCQVAVKLIGV